MLLFLLFSPTRRALPRLRVRPPPRALPAHAQPAVGALQPPVEQEGEAVAAAHAHALAKAALLAAQLHGAGGRAAANHRARVLVVVVLSLGVGGGCVVLLLLPGRDRGGLGVFGVGGRFGAGESELDLPGKCKRVVLNRSYILRMNGFSIDVAAATQQRHSNEP